MTIAFRDGYGSQQYVSNAAFKSRPVAEDMAKQGIDLCNLFVADDPAIRFTYVPAMPGHEKESVEIFNSTEKDIVTRVRNVRTGETFDVTVPAKSMVVR